MNVNDFPSPIIAAAAPTRGMGLPAHAHEAQRSSPVARVSNPCRAGQYAEQGKSSKHCLNFVCLSRCRATWHGLETRATNARRPLHVDVPSYGRVAGFVAAAAGATGAGVLTPASPASALRNSAGSIQSN